MGAGRRIVTFVAAAACALVAGGCMQGPPLGVSNVVTGLDHPWDIGFAGNTMIFTERAGRISALVNGQRRVLASPSDVVQASEAGMMGLAVDPAFNSNRYIYVCMASTRGGPTGDVRVVRWKVAFGFTTLFDRTDIVTGIPVNTAGQLGRHSGCRPRFDPNGFLWIGTGDAATGTVPQNPRSLGGKILRVARSGWPAPGNPGGVLDPRIYSYGHRNVQGIAFRSTDGLGVSVEHGPGTDDELNFLLKGNFGWDPVPGYNEFTPMTDFRKFPNAVAPLWRSGYPTVAPSGATFIRGSQWGALNGTLAVALLKGTRLVAFKLGFGRVLDMGQILGSQYGRLRTPVQGPNGLLYVTTDNGGGGDRILRVGPA
jgi:glucose/arabinose dehydrogenase